MNITYPHAIENCMGEKLIFLEVKKEHGGDKVLVENYVTPGNGPVMHTHWLQDEELTVMEGRLAYQVQGQPVQYAGKGETVLFRRGVAHKFWNDGQDTLHCKGWIQPANNVVYFISALFAAQNKSGKGQPETFDGAYLMKRYAKEFDIPEIPGFVKKVIIPVTYFTGKLLGKYEHFKNAPEAVKS